MRKRKANIGKLIGVALAALITSLLALNHQPKEEKTAVTVDHSVHQVTYVFDGDTVKLDNGEHVRFIGIDTPESQDNQKLRRDVKRRNMDAQTQMALGKKAARYVRNLLTGQKVRLEFDVESRDRYGRLLAYLYLPDGTFVNQKIIEEGYAYPMTIPPNVRHAKDFQKSFEQARENRRGLWK